MGGLEYRGGKESWGNKLLNILMENGMIQWIKEATRFRGEDTPARLDLLFSKEPDVIGEINYKCPIGKSDHVVIEFNILEGRAEPRDESYKKGRLNYAKANFGGFK